MRLSRPGGPARAAPCSGGVSDRDSPPAPTEFGGCCHPQAEDAGFVQVLDGNSAGTPREQPEGRRKVSSSPCPIAANAAQAGEVTKPQRAAVTGRGDSWQGDAGGRRAPMPPRCAKPSSPPAQQWAGARRGHRPCPRLAAASATCLLSPREQGEGQAGCSLPAEGGTGWAGRAGQSLCCCLCHLAFTPLPSLCCSPPPPQAGGGSAAFLDPAVPVPHLCLSSPSCHLCLSGPSCQEPGAVCDALGAAPSFRVSFRAEHVS